MTWYHGTTAEMAERAADLGRIPSDYASRKAVWGPGVYMSDDADEVKRWGEEHLALNLADAKMWDVSTEPWGWGPITVMDNLPEPHRTQAREADRARMDAMDYGSEPAGIILRNAIMAMGFDGLVFRGDNDNCWAVCYRPELVQAQRHDPAPQLSRKAPSAAEVQEPAPGLSVDL